MNGASNVPVEALAEQLDDERIVWVRLAAVREGEAWVIRLLEATAGEAPPRWQPCRWEYGDAALLAIERKGAVLAKWLRTGHATIRPYRLSLEEVAETATRDRRESQWAGGVHEPLRWPSEVWRLGRTVNTANPHGELIGAGNPSFASFDIAVTCLLGVGIAGWNLSGNEFLVRRQDDRGRLTTVHVHPDEVRAYVEGRQLRGAVVELAGNQPGPTVELTRNRTRTVRFGLESGLPDGAWIILRRDNEWLDRKFLSRPFRRGDERGVEFAVEAATRIEVMVSSGEGPSVEYKQVLPADDDESKRSVMKTVAAFANGEGGAIIFGVSDDGNVIGFSATEAGRRARDRLTNLVKSWVWPLPSFTIEALPAPELKDRVVIVLTVEPGDHRPYAAGTQPTNFVYYVRRGANSYAVGPTDVRALARSGHDVDAYGVLSPLLPRPRRGT